MKNTLLKVMKFLDKNELVNTSSIHNDAMINWSSLGKSLKFLLEKQIVSMNQNHDKKNNEKLFSLNKNRAVVYGDHLINYKMNLSNWKDQREIIKELYKRLEKFPEDFLDWWMYFTPETAKKKRIKYLPARDFFSKKDNKTKIKGAYIQIKSLSNKEIDIIFRDFCNKHYCPNCFKKSKKILGGKLTKSNAEEYQRRYGDPKERRIKYGVDVNKFKTPLLTEVKEDREGVRCTLCTNALPKNNEPLARQIGKRRKYDQKTTETKYLSYSDLMEKKNKKREFDDFAPI